MNAESEEAVAFLAEPTSEVKAKTSMPVDVSQQKESFWSWRLRMVERIAQSLDPDRFGVAGFYIFGSTKNATAGIASDIDVLIHFRGAPEQLDRLNHWLEGWSYCLSEMNYLRTGYRSAGLLDVHIVSDDDIAAKSGYAAKIGAITDAAQPLQMMSRKE